MSLESLNCNTKNEKYFLLNAQSNKAIAFHDFHLPPQSPTCAQKPSIESFKANQLKSEITLEKEIINAAEQLVDCEIEYAREKYGNEKQKCPSKLMQARKSVLGAINESGINYRTALWHVCERRCALFVNSDESVAPYLLVYLQKIQEQCLQTIGTILYKQKTAKKPLQCITHEAKLFIPANHSKKFTCAADENCPKKTYTKVTHEPKDWQIQNAELLKSIKHVLKERIKSTIQLRLQNKLLTYGSLSLPLKIALDNFKHLLEKVQANDPTFNTHSEVLDEMCALLDGYCKNGGALASDTKLHEIYADVSYKKQHNEALNLYKYTEEFFRKDNKDDDVIFVHHLDSAVVIRLQACLQTICNHLEQELNGAQKTEIEAKQKFSLHETEKMVQLISDYLIRIIKIHKNLSYNRFVFLFTLHTAFLNRVQFILNKIVPEQRDRVQLIVEKALSPTTTLLETKKHRSTQARHTWKEAAVVRKHTNLSEINQYIRCLTLGEPHDLVSFQAAHIIPFPALFAFRENESQETNKQTERISQKRNLKSALVSKKYIEANIKEKDKLFASDIETLFAENKEDPVLYIKHALELVMKIALEEASQTVHLPALFNQEADGASEKYIGPLSKDNEIDKLLQKHLQKNQSSKVNENTCLYTEKVYKYILSHDLFEMISQRKELNLPEVMFRESNYIEAVKLSVAQRLKWVSSQPQTLTYLILAVALCNVFLGLKNAEAFGGIELTVGDKQCIEGLYALQAWEKQLITEHFSPSIE